MNTLTDVRQIIKPLPCKYEYNMDNIFENLIINNKIIFNSFILRHIIYSNNDTMFNMNIEQIIMRHIITNIKNQRIHFNKLNKMGKLTINNFNEYFNNFYKLLVTINGIVSYIIPNSITNERKWGDNIIVNYSIKNIILLLCDDNVFHKALEKSISNNDISIFNKDIYIFNKFLIKFIPYDKLIFLYYYKFIDILQISLIENYQPMENVLDMSENILSIYNFKNIYRYYMNIICKYKFIKIDDKSIIFHKLNNFISDVLKDIISNTDIISLRYFINTYKKEIVRLMDHIDITVILLSKMPTDINTFITYYYTLNNIYQENIIYQEVLHNSIKENINKIFNTKEHIEHLGDIINTHIISRNTDTSLQLFYYKIGSYINNIDELGFYLCQKLMERIMYLDIDLMIEMSHLSDFICMFNMSKKDDECIRNNK